MEALASSVSRRTRLPVWRPAPSLGAVLGIAISAVALLCIVALVKAGSATSSTATQIACGLGALLGSGCLLVALVSTWWCLSLRYALGAGALEVRYGTRLLRFRYDEIEEITGRVDEGGRVPTLWPGAYFGRTRGPDDAELLWCATSRAPRAGVVVSAAGTGLVITPSDLESFRGELIDHARSAPYVGSQAPPHGGSWLDRISGSDLWVRAMLFGAGVVATVVVVLDVALFGSLQSDGLGSVAILLLNTVAALSLSGRWPMAGRLLAAGALAGQIGALL